MPIALVALAAAWVGWQIIANTMADTFAAADPTTALGWRSSHATALVALGDQAIDAVNQQEEEAGLTPGQVASIEASATRAIRANPLQEGALRQLAIVAEAKGDIENAVSLMQLAALRSQRDVRAQAWLLSQYLATDELEEALETVDIMLRQWPDLADLALPVLTGAASEKESSALLVRYLETSPPWRNWFLTNFPEQIDDPQILDAVYSGLRTAPPTRDELRAYIWRMVKLGDLDRAYAIWRNYLPPERMTAIPSLRNGGFDGPMDNIPFEWEVGGLPGVRTEVRVDQPGNPALRVQFFDAIVPYRHVWQLLLLTPGQHRLVGKVKSTDLQNARGLEWAITCKGSGRQIGATERFSGTTEWIPFELTFVVPPDPNCHAQELRLQIPARSTEEEKTAGEIWFDELAITTSPATMSQP